jgi:putative ABC transport system ATP-binding protein
MNILGCLDVPTAGRYLLDGTDVSRVDASDLADFRNRKIGFVFQSFNLLSKLDALGNVELPLVYAGMHRRERRRRAHHALQSLGLDDRASHRPSEMSGGQQQRVAIARAIVTNPSIVLADEPTGNLDSQVTADVLDIFDRVSMQGRTIVLITHEDDVAHRAKRVIVLSDGAVVEDRRQALVAAPPPGIAGSRRRAR